MGCDFVTKAFYSLNMHSQEDNSFIQSSSINPVPEETARIARAANPKGNPYMAFRDELDRSFKDDVIVDIVQDFGEASPTSLHLAMVTILQFRENLSDYQAAEAVRSRITWKYVLGLELTDPGFESSLLGDHRVSLKPGSRERYLLDWLVERCRPFGLLKARGKQHVDTDYVLAKIQRLNQ
jgi:transposase